MLQCIHPETWAPTRGYSAGMLGEGKVLYIAGQIGWNANQQFETEDFVEQFTQTLKNVIAVVRSAGGSPEDISSLTVYVTDLSMYRARLRELSEPWKQLMGKHYPAMALVGVTGLVEEKAQIEIQGFAVLSKTIENVGIESE